MVEVMLTLHPRAPSRVITLTLYYREGCHLCEVMLQALRGLQPHTPGHPLSPDGDSPCMGFSLQLVDVDRDPELMQRYDEWVPVLCCGEQEICHYQLDEQALSAALRSQ